MHDYAGNRIVAAKLAAEGVKVRKSGDVAGGQEFRGRVKERRSRGEGFEPQVPAPRADWPQVLISEGRLSLPDKLPLRAFS
jgi:hypothetical protein